MKASHSDIMRSRYYDAVKEGEPKRPKLLRGMNHERLCPCQSCDIIRQDNGNGRTAINWPRDYPPKFYANVDWSAYEYG